MSETLAEFAARYDGIHPENGDDIWTFARDAWAAIKAEVDRQKTEAERTPEPEPLVCVRCRQPIGCEGETYYLGGEGIVHVACVPRSERKSPGSPVSLDKDAAEIMRLRAELADKDDALARLTGRGLYAGGPPAVPLDEALDALVTVLKHWAAE